MIFIKSALLALIYYQSSSVNAAVWDSSYSNDISVKEAALELTKIYENADPDEKSVLLQDEDFMNSIAAVSKYYETPLKNFELDSFEDEDEDEDEDGEMEYFEDEDEDEDEDSEDEFYFEDEDEDEDEDESSDSDSWSDSYEDSDEDEDSEDEEMNWAYELFETIPDDLVREQFNEYIEKGDVETAAALLKEYFNKYVAEMGDEEKAEMINEEDILEAIDLVYGSDSDSWSDSYEDSDEDEDESSDSDSWSDSYSSSDSMSSSDSDSWSDSYSSSDSDSWSDSYEDSDEDEDEDSEDEFYFEDEDESSDSDSWSDSYSSSDSMSSSDSDSWSDSYESNESADAEVKISPKKAIEMIDAIPDKSVNEKVHEKIKSGDVEGAEDIVHDYFDKFMAKEKDDDGKKIILANKQKIIKALDYAVEHYNDKTSEASFEKDFTKKTIEDALDAVKRDQDKIEKIVKGLRGN